MAFQVLKMPYSEVEKFAKYSAAAKFISRMLEGYDKIPWVREEWKKDQYEKAMAMMKADEKE